MQLVQTPEMPGNQPHGSRVVLVNPLNLFTSFRKFEVLSLGYLASFLEFHGYAVDIYDCNFMDPRPEAIADYCCSLNPTACGITTMVGGTSNAIAIAECVRRLSPETAIILGGYAATFEYLEILQACPAIDFVIRGEGEVALLRFISLLSQGKPLAAQQLSKLPGLVHRIGHGRLHVSPSVEMVQDLDTLPFPRRSPMLTEIGLASILSSRGCQALCSFCSIQEFYRLGSQGAIRCRTPANVIDEIENIHRTTGISLFLFIDDNFFGSERYMTGRLAAIARGLINRGLSKLRFEVSSRAADLRLPELGYLAEAGLSRVYLGLEFGSDTQLRRYRKGCRVKRNKWAIDEIRKHGVGIDFGYIPFDPFLEPQELIDSLQFLLDNDLVYPWSLNVVTVSTNLFPGTHVHQMAKEAGVLHQTSDFNYWFDFKNEEYNKIFEDLLRYFKTKYLLNVVDRYSVGYSQQNFKGPELSLLQPSLRLIFSLWIDRIRHLLAKRETSEIDQVIGRAEAVLVSILTAQIIRNERALRTSDVWLQSRVTELSEELAALLPGISLRGLEEVDERWVEPLSVEHEYIRLRDRNLPLGAGDELVVVPPDDDNAVQLNIHDLPPKSKDGLPPLLDVFILPDVDHFRSDVSPSWPPPTLYLGSVTGTVPLDLEILTNQGNVGFYRLHKGWTEIPLPTCKETESLILKFKPSVLLQRRFDIKLNKGRFGPQNTPTAASSVLRRLA